MKGAILTIIIAQNFFLGYISCWSKYLRKKKPKQRPGLSELAQIDRLGLKKIFLTKNQSIFSSLTQRGTQNELSIQKIQNT